jgi:hypothetical protein
VSTVVGALMIMVIAGLLQMPVGRPGVLSYTWKSQHLRQWTWLKSTTDCTNAKRIRRERSGSRMSDTFETDLRELLKKHGRDSNSTTPDFVLARYLLSSLEAFDTATNRRDEWFEGWEKKDQKEKPSDVAAPKTGFLLKLEAIRNRLKKKK